MSDDLKLAILTARDLKINIRLKATSMFFELDRLDQAAGGVNPALGKQQSMIVSLSTQLTSTRYSPPPTNQSECSEAITCSKKFNL